MVYFFSDLYIFSSDFEDFWVKVYWFYISKLRIARLESETPVCEKWTWCRFWEIWCETPWNFLIFRFKVGWAPVENPFDSCCEFSEFSAGARVTFIGILIKIARMLGAFSPYAVWKCEITHFSYCDYRIANVSYFSSYSCITTIYKFNTKSENTIHKKDLSTKCKEKKNVRRKESINLWLMSITRKYLNQ